MSITQNDLLLQARELLSAAASEVQFRNVVGRAYYAAYHEATRFHNSLPTAGKPPHEPSGVHAVLAHRLRNPLIPASDARFRNSQNIGRHLAWMHEKRIKADYRLLQTIGKSECEEVIRRAERVF